MFTALKSDRCSAQEDNLVHTCADNPRNGVTKAEARDVVRQIAYVLRHRFDIGRQGPGKDVVLATSSLSPFLPIVFYGIMAAGGVYSGASTAFSVGELVRQIKTAEAKLLICSKEYEKNMTAAAKECHVPPDRILVIDSSVPKQWKLLSSGFSQADVLQSFGGRMMDWQRLSNLRDLTNTTACLLFSSGTTGLPKGVRLSHWNLVANNVFSMEAGARYKARRTREGRPFTFRTIAHLPMAHIAGIQQFSINPFYMGGTAYWMPKYDFDKFIEYSRRYKTTYQLTVPPIWLQVAKSSKVTNHFDSLEIACSGAAPMGLELVKEISNKLGQGKIFMTQTWGTTETDGSITATDWDIRDETGSVGGILPNVKLRIIDDDDKDVQPGEIGEMLVSGPGVCQGYHNNPSATSAAFLDGFYRTGDVGYFKNDLIYLVDRKKELIKYKGLQVAPAELEDLLMSHPKIADAAVIGVQSKKYGSEVPKAFVVASAVSGKEVMDFVKANLSGHKQLRGGVEFVDEIPKSASGKILRKELRLRPFVERAKAKL
ncbi:hypothetical protein PRZ48_006208 [Zasmidium cellare]|uniref:4-coumarate-CoA ligase n=1 Tax=Zasmidium cellare TaxID=395010 RepID=A0ABR0EMR5_ZASCE|nr:hypothetical protein PRZ48_006208 [Zasmidium cellare]